MVGQFELDSNHCLVRMRGVGDLDAGASFVKVAFGVLFDLE